MENADLVMMHVRAKAKKGRVSIDDILGKEANKGGTVKEKRKVTPDEKRSELSFLEDELGGSEYISS
ncbi:hypothetical protein GJU41_12035 [Bacillus idriensis]|uniref:Uncharacterized protein n=1 Tax=Metabacillus idriensis TaxID=324768 RepID=A0A6I2MFW8_9BACI|nr:hypothetical protein [Metabacillus idriensis]MRX54703.1 hypothetical protein [Metabacillus idriensis]